MKTVLIAPRKYVQGKGVLQEIGEYTSILGKPALVLWDTCVKGLIEATVTASFEKAKVDLIDVVFQGECTKEEAQRVAQIAKKDKADVIIGAGGGKALDTAKAAAIELGLPYATCPTIASNDSPTSAATVWYDEEGNCQGFDCWPFNPDLVIVDTEVIAKAPVSTFVSGMGDALSTWVEAEAAYKTRALNLAGGCTTQAALTLARLGFDLLMEYGVEAKRAVEQQVVTPAVERVVEANVLHSGLGFESSGLATAHMVANILPSFPECHHLMHGHKVGFGVITQLCLDDEKPVDEIYEIVDWEIAVGLPVTFEELGLKNITRERLQPIGDFCAGEGSLSESHPFKVTSDSVVDACIAADALGRERKGLV